MFFIPPNIFLKKGVGVPSNEVSPDGQRFTNKIHFFYLGYLLVKLLFVSLSKK
jgi:hypothetical protein